MKVLEVAMGAVCGAFVRLLAVGTILDISLEVLFGRPAGWFWVDLRFMPAGLRLGLLFAFALGVLAYPRCSRRVQSGVRGLAMLGMAVCAWDAGVFWKLRSAGGLFEAWWVPVSAPIALVLAWWAVVGADGVMGTGRRSWFARRALEGGVIVPVLVAHVLAFGGTDYRRPADAAVVFGAAVSPSGEPSLSLADRTRTAVALYHDGLVGHLILSGGHDPADPVSEPEAMRRLAVELGVPESAIILDEGGVNTLATVRRTAGLVRERGWERVLMVSQGWHLARIKLFSERQGLRCYTVPAMETRPLHRENFYIMREAAALLWYWVRPETFS